MRLQLTVEGAQSPDEIIATLHAVATAIGNGENSGQDTHGAVPVDYDMRPEPADSRRS